MAGTYDDSNIFAKILAGDIPCNKVYEDEFVLAFHDINPQTDVHVLVIPKGPYVSLADFAAKAAPELITGFYRAVSHIARELLQLDEGGYRTITNHGANAHQEVPHFHLHILGGRPLGPMLDRQFSG